MGCEQIWRSQRESCVLGFEEIRTPPRESVLGCEEEIRTSPRESVLGLVRVGELGGYNLEIRGGQWTGL